MFNFLKQNSGFDHGKLKKYTPSGLPFSKWTRGEMSDHFIVPADCRGGLSSTAGGLVAVAMALASGMILRSADY
jgi:hypothetical protein